MIKIVSILTFAFVLFSCGQKTKSTEEAATKPQVSTTPDTHTAQVSLDYAGTYRGVLPCADCEGIETEVVLDYDGNFIKRTRYLGKESSPVIEETGTFTWNEEGNAITFNDIANAPNQYFVGENQLIQLDMNGNRITGEAASQFILIKE